MNPSLRRWLPRLAIAVLAAMVLVGTALLVAPELLGLPSVKSEVERRLSQAASGHVAWDHLGVRLLPAPHVEMRGVTLDIPGRAHAVVDQVQARLRLLSLLHGQVEFLSIELLRPVIRLDVPASAPSTGESAPDPMARYHALAALLEQTARSAATGALLEVSEGDLQVRGADVPEVRLRDLSLRAQTDPTGLALRASAAGNLWEQLKLAGRFEFGDLSANVRLDIDALKTQVWLDHLLADAGLHVDVSPMELHAHLIADAKTELRCEFEVKVASLQLLRAGQRLQISDSGLQGAVAMRTHEIDVAISALRIGSLIPQGRAALHMDASAGRPRIALEIPKLEVGALRDAVLALAGDDIRVRRYAARALGGTIAELSLRSESDDWHGLLEPAHLAGSAILEHAAVALPAIDLEARDLSGHIGLSREGVELTGASAVVGQSKLSDIALRYSLREGTTFASTVFELDLPQALASARHAFFPEQSEVLQEIEAAGGQSRGRASFSSAGPDWKAAVEVVQSTAWIRLRSLPWPVSLQAGQTSITPGQISITHLAATAGGSSFAEMAATLAAEPELRLVSGSGKAVLDLEQIYRWLRAQGGLRELLDNIESASGSAQVILDRISGALARPSELAFDATLVPEQLSIATKHLPGPLRILGGAVHIDQDTVRLDRVGAAMLDAQGSLSGEIVHYRGAGLQMQVDVADATVGADCAHWIWQRAGAPAQFEPRAPLHLVPAHLTLHPARVVEAQGSVTFEGGPELTLDLHWDPDVLELRRVVIRDRNSNATFGLRARKELVEANFSGTIFAQSIAAMFQRPGDFQGQATGDLHVTLDLQLRGRSSAQGRIVAQGLDLDELLPAQARAQACVERLDVSADGTSLQIHEAMVRWAEQTATIRGQIARKDAGVLVDVELDSPGIRVDALPLHREMTQPEAGAPANSEEAQRAALFSWLRAVALSGRVKLRSDFVDFDRYHFAPVTAALTIGAEQAELRLEDAQLCGLSLPMTLQIKPDGVTAFMPIRAHKQQLEAVARCLTDQRLVLTGEFDAYANLTTHGSSVERLANLDGSIHLESRNGMVKKFALLGNILAIADLGGLFDRSLSDLAAEGFAYRTLDLDGHFSQGRLVVEDFTFDSSAVGLAAEGSVGLAQRDTQLTVLVAPFSRLTNLFRKLPIIGYVLNGSLTCIPVGVHGDIRDPIVVPLDPLAVASNLAAIFTRALKLPEKMLAPPSSGPATASPPGH